MTDATGATDTQAESGTQPPAGTATTQAEGAEGDQAPQPEMMSLEEARKLRSEANTLRKRLKDLEDKDRRATEAQLSEQERKDKRLAEIERELADRTRELHEYRVDAAIEKAAAKSGFANPELAARLIDQAALEVDDDGTPKNVDQLVGSLAKSYPNLLTKAPLTGSGDLGLGGGQGASRTVAPGYDRLSQAYADIAAKRK